MEIPLAVPLISAGVNVLGSIFGASRADKAKRKAEADERVRRAEMDRLKNIYSNIDTSNPFLNMENTMEDLTINQQAAQFQAQQFQQSQANILNTLRSSAGGSGIASLAQSLAQQGQLAAQRSAADIGSQESRNQALAAQQAAQIQQQERRGELISRQQQRDQVGTLLGMSQSEVAAARNQAQMAQQAKMGAISSGVQGLTSLAGSVIGAPEGTFGGGGSIDNSYTQFGALGSELDPEVFNIK
tara:strand:- start:1055 stop:1783 length:729 start_codon:yes stop_codon:yes gene_type:complete